MEYKIIEEIKNTLLEQYDYLKEKSYKGKISQNLLNATKIVYDKLKEDGVYENNVPIRLMYANAVMRVNRSLIVNTFEEFLEKQIFKRALLKLSYQTTFEDDLDYIIKYLKSDNFNYNDLLDYLHTFESNKNVF